jgi:hypothetical protein
MSKDGQSLRAPASSWNSNLKSPWVCAVEKRRIPVGALTAWQPPSFKSTVPPSSKSAPGTLTSVQRTCHYFSAGDAY